MTEDIAQDIESDTLREAELMQAETLLGDLVGRKVTAVHVEETRIAVVADNGITYYFYGFMGEGLPREPAET
jgi:hypothetical protein